MVPVANRPEDKAGPSHHQCLWKITPITTVLAFHGVVAKGEVGVGADDEFGFFIGKQRGRIASPIPTSNEIVHMPRIAILFRWLFRIETVNIFEAGGRGIEPFAVEINVAVVADAHMFAALSDEALNVMRLLNQAWNMIRVKDNNVALARRLEIVDKAVHEQVIATDCLEFDELLAFPNHLAVDQSGPLPQILNGKPKRIRLVSDPQG